MQNKKILVTGGAGFIGSNSCENIFEKKFEVICLDNFAAGRQEDFFNLLKHDVKSKSWLKIKY